MRVTLTHTHTLKSRKINEEDIGYVIQFLITMLTCNEHIF